MKKFNQLDSENYDLFMEETKKLYEAVIVDGLGSTPFDLSTMIKFVPRVLQLGALTPAYKFVTKFWKNYLTLNMTNQIDSKTKLQEYSLKKFKVLPIYKLLGNSGPRHKPIFKVGVRLQNSKMVNATGNSKKDAQQKAATLLLK